MGERIDWIVLKFDESPNKMWCKRCGEMIDAPMPCKIDTATRIMNAFTDAHKKCKDE